jgi:diadenosine tetraphosphatase ApaH/serine/threonine PP2A family protein phosphatase
MRVAVISDIHANLHALDAVLEVIDAEPPDAIWCLGDLVGYGPRPNECCARVRERADVCLVGNHDLVALERLSIEDFNFEAASAARWTREELDVESRTFLESLEPLAELERAQLFHASARDPVWEYVLSNEAALATMRLTTAPLVLVGHSHVALSIVLEDQGFVSGGLAPDGARIELGAERRLLNPGSVGQPRDGDPRAAWLLLDFEARFASFRRVAYSIERTQRELRDAGLPEVLGARLAIGQ